MGARGMTDRGGGIQPSGGNQAGYGNANDEFAQIDAGTDQFSRRGIDGGTNIVDESAARIAAAARGGNGAPICIKVRSDGTRIQDQEGGQGNETIAIIAAGHC